MTQRTAKLAILMPSPPHEAAGPFRVRSFLRRHGLLIALTGIFAVSAIDRQVLVILLQDIKRDLMLTDSQLGLLSGFAFVMVYVVMGVPVAYLADKKSRSKIISIAMAFWSGMTMSCGLAQNYLQLVLARCGVGIGEAGCTPSAHSMIADRYESNQRATALGVYGTGFFIGSFLGFCLGGWIGGHYGWRVALVVVGAPGVPIAALIWLFMKEPYRRNYVRGEDRGFVSSVGALWQLRSFRWYVTGASMAVFAAAGMLTWLPALAMREYGTTMSSIGVMLGLINGAGGILGATGIGVLADHVSLSDRRWNLRLCSILVLLCAPATAAAFLADNLGWTLAFYAVPVTLSAGLTAPIISVTQQTVPSNLHAMVTATVFLVCNLIGFGLGPLWVGMVSDALSPTMGEAQALRHALLYLSVFFGIAAIMIAIGARHHPRQGVPL